MPQQWEKIHIRTNEEGLTEGIAPIIISASRATDIPAFYTRWFFNRLQAGYVRWENCFNPNQKIYVSFSKTRLVVFWTKNPSPILHQLYQLDERNIHYYFHYTVNNYDKEGFEPNVPPLDKRIDTFKQLADQIGKEKVVWRISPYIQAEELPWEELLDRTEKTGNELIHYTDKLAIGFANVFKYRNVGKNLINNSSLYNKQNIHLSEFTPEQKINLVRGLAKLAEGWRKINPAFRIGACSEEMDFTPYGIEKNKCIDDDLIIRLFPNDPELLSFIGYEPDLFGGGDTRTAKDRRKLKDRNQRPICQCIFSKDIGSYNTCPHYCIYCYANRSPKQVEKNIKNINATDSTLFTTKSD